MRPFVLMTLLENVIKDGGANALLDALKTNKTIAELDVDCTLPSFAPFDFF